MGHGWREAWCKAQDCWFRPAGVIPGCTHSRLLQHQPHDDPMLNPLPYHRRHMCAPAHPNQPVCEVPALPVALAAVEQHEKVGGVTQHSKAAAPQLGGIPAARPAWQTCMSAAMELCWCQSQLAAPLAMHKQNEQQTSCWCCSLTAWRAVTAQKSGAPGCQTPCTKGNRRSRSKGCV